MEVKKCVACLKEKELKSFGKNKNAKDNLQYRCKVCMANGILKPKKEIKFLPGDDIMLKLNCISKDDYIDSFLLLEKMGYNPKINIHEQFCMKHGLKPKDKYYHKDKNYYSQEDLIDFL
jgi:hypothetical protein